jgi:hypothetical protein
MEREVAPNRFPLVYGSQAAIKEKQAEKECKKSCKKSK